MKTVTIIVGNSDNRLTQLDWARFCRDISQFIDSKLYKKQFAAPSIGWHTFQNACWVIEVEDERFDNLKENIKTIREHYLQDSAAIIVGNTEFI